MGKLNKDVNKFIAKMIQTGGMNKGVYGEKAVFRVCEELYQTQGGILYHSYKYGVSKELEGNIKRAEDGHFYLERLGSDTEIDILFATEYKIFPIEVKAYKAKKITLTDEAISGCFQTSKSPVHQNEMHCRHLYPKLLSALPNGASKYIEPIVVFVDNCVVEDKRSKEQKAYIKVTTLNGISSVLKKLNKPSEYRIDLKILDRCLRDACISSEQYFTLRTK